MSSEKRDAEEFTTLTAGGWLAKVEVNLVAMKKGEWSGRPVSYKEICLLRAVSNLREACMVLSADVARLKKQHLGVE